MWTLPLNTQDQARMLVAIKVPNWSLAMNERVFVTSPSPTASQYLPYDSGAIREDKDGHHAFYVIASFDGS